MSQSPLARSRPRKSLSAFARAPSSLSQSTSSRDLFGDHDNQQSPSPRASKNAFASQNAFATPTKANGSFDTPTQFRRRNTGTGYGSPLIRTPIRTEVTYSPYAHTPPRGLSKSTSMPFDLAANAREARQAEEETARRSEEARLRAESSPLQKPHKKRLVRRKAWWRRVIESPFDLFDSISFAIPNTVDDVLPPARFANPIALVLYIIHWMILAPIRGPDPERVDVIRSRPYRSGVDERWGRYEERAQGPRRGIAGSRTSFLVTLALFIIATANAVYLFTRYRNYDMQLRSANEPIPSPNASPVPLPTGTAQDEQYDENGNLQHNDETPKSKRVDKVARTTGHVLLVVLKWAVNATLSAFGFRPPASASGFDSRNSIQSLRVWVPPDFCLAFFCAMPPSAPVISYLLTTPSPVLTPIINLVTSFLLSHLSASFSQLVKDRMLLSAEVMKEYDRRFVYKHVFSARVDRGVGTSDP